MNRQLTIDEYEHMDTLRRVALALASGVGWSSSC